MSITEKHIEVKDYLTKSNLPANDYVINPYIGCPHACKYCYACFMKRFTGHNNEPWGSFIDIKHCDKPINAKLITGRTVFLSSVTDCYNQLEENHGITRKILEQLVFIDCELGISTKSKLILRDIDLLKQCKNLKVSMSINTLDENFKNDMDNASSIADRLSTLNELHSAGIHTVLFMSPIFPEITDFKAIIEKTHSYIDEYWFENLNLRGGYKQTILAYIDEKYPQLSPLYENIFIKKGKEYWVGLAAEIDDYCNANNVSYINYFYHNELVKAKLARQKEQRLK